MRPFIADLDACGEVVDISHPLSPEFELAAVLALFDRGPAVRAATSGSAFPVVGNLLNSRQRIARALGTDPTRLLTKLAAAFKEPVPTTPVPAGRCQEVVLGPEAVWEEVIAPRFFAKDAGGYVTAGMVVAHDPVTGVRNASYARLRPIGPTSGLMGIAPNHHLAALARSAASGGHALPIAIVMGAHPAVQVAACFYLGLGQDELEHAGRLLGDSVRVVQARTSDVLVPADAELAIEAVLHADRPVSEGLVNEYHGMYEDYGDGYTVEFSALTRRRNPWLQVILPGWSSEHSYLAALPIAAGLYQGLKARDLDVADVAVTHAGGGRVDVVISLAHQESGDPKRAISACLSALGIVKLVTVVDADIDVWDAEQVHWARSCRMRWERDLVLLEGATADRNVPMQVGGAVTKVGMDATIKLGDRAAGPEVAVPPIASVLTALDWIAREQLASSMRPALSLGSMLARLDEKPHR